MEYNTKNYDYLIVGSGPFGATFACEAAERGKKVLVIEKRAHIGGNMYTHKENGINVHDYGAYILHTDNKEVWSYVSRLTEFNGHISQVVANYKGELYNLPFNMNTLYRIRGVKIPAEAQARISEQREAAGIKGAPKDSEKRAVRLIGTDIYEKLIKGYTEKQWGCRATELPSSIIRCLSARFTFNNNYFNHRYQGVPVDGYTTMFDKLLKSELIDIQLNKDFLAEKETYLSEFPKIVYTGVIDAFFDYPYGELEHRSVRFENETVDSNNAQDSAVVNYTDAETPYTRIMKWRHFGQKADENKTVLTKEYPQDWDCSKEAYYPVNDEKSSLLFRKYEEKANTQEKVIFGGRLANYQYYDMSQIFGAALKAVAEEFGETAN